MNPTRSGALRLGVRMAASMRVTGISGGRPIDHQDPKIPALFGGNWQLGPHKDKQMRRSLGSQVPQKAEV